jgi:hypothetical protein
MWRERLETLYSDLKRSLDDITANLAGEGGVFQRRASHGKEPHDRRRSRRMDVDHDVSFWIDDREPLSAHLVNISREGLFLKTEAKLEKGQVMKIRLPAMSKGRFPGITTGRVVRLNRQGVGVRCL